MVPGVDLRKGHPLTSGCQQWQESTGSQVLLTGNYYLPGKIHKNFAKCKGFVIVNRIFAVYAPVLLVKIQLPDDYR